MEQQKEKELSFHRQDIEKKHRNVIIHYLQYENDILEKRISRENICCTSTDLSKEECCQRPLHPTIIPDIDLGDASGLPCSQN